MVLGLCRRVLGNADDAEDAFQAAFLVLATRAGSIRKMESLTSWLHGVAYRLALRAKRDAGRRRKHEGRVEPRANPPAWEIGWRELQAILDEEVQRLAPAERAAFVLCCLEGLSKTEAAERLGIKANTVSSQLARARKRLQERLGRRGISLTAALAALAVSGAGRAAVAPRLVRTAAAAACRLGAGTLVPGLSARALSLAEGVTTMLTNKTKRAAVLLLALCALGIGLGALAQPAAEKPARQPTPRTVAPPAPKPDSNAIEVGGRVLGPDGKPVEGLWADLASKDEARALRAALALAASRETVAFLKERLGPVKADPKRLARLLKQLDSGSFARREAATAELDYLGRFIKADLEKALAGKPSVEVKKRIQGLLGRIEAETTAAKGGRPGGSPDLFDPLAQSLNLTRPTPVQIMLQHLRGTAHMAAPRMAWVRAARAVAVLEQIGTPEATKILEALAGGEAEAPPTKAAKQALGRLKQR